MGPLCKIEGRGWEDGWGGPIPDFLFGQEVSTPWNACTAVDQQHGGCSQTHCHTWRERGGKKGNVNPFSFWINSVLHKGPVEAPEN